MLRSPSLIRFLGMMTLGTLAVVVMAFVAPWQLAVLTGWIVAASAFLIGVWRVILTSDGERTRQLSTREDDSQPVGTLLIVVASTGSLAGALLALHKAARVDRPESVLLTVASVLVVVVSWLVVNTEYTLRYADHFYKPPVGGVEFPGADVPDYRDFAYLAFTIGMTYQVSDTSLLTPRFRRLLLAHAAAAYVFGVVIVAAVINIVAGVVQ